MKYLPLPDYEQIDFAGLRKFPMSIILQAGSNVLTQYASNHWMDFPYKPAFTHALIYIADDDCLSMGFNAQIFKIQELYRPSQRWVVIHFRDITQKVIEDGIRIAYNRAGSNETKYKFYDVMGYLGFLSRCFPVLGKAKFLHGSKKTEFCSDQVVNVLKEAGYPLFNGLDGNLVSPCDIFMLCAKWTYSYFQELKN